MNTFRKRTAAQEVAVSVSTTGKSTAIASRPVDQSATPETMMEHVDMLSVEEERLLVVRAKQGDEEAFGVLFRAYQKKLLHVSNDFLRNVDDSLEVVQDVFIKVFRSMSTFNTDLPFYPWVYKILKNHCLRTIDKRKHAAFDSLDELEAERFTQFTSSDELNPEELCVREQNRLALWMAIDRLKSDSREIIVMKNFHNLSYKEIAETLNIPIGTVMSRLFNARQELKHIMETEHAEIVAGF